MDELDVERRDTSWVQGVDVGDSGTKLVTGTPNGEIVGHDISTNDIGFSIDPSNSYTVDDNSNVGTDLTGISFNDTGSKVFVLDSSTGNLHEFALSTNWDISTHSLTNSVSVKLGSNVGALEFNNDGTRVYTANSNSVFEYHLSTAYDTTSSVTFDNQYDSASYVRGFCWDNDGDTAETTNDTSDELIQHKLL